jgi:DUF1680 family protein
MRKVCCEHHASEGFSRRDLGMFGLLATLGALVPAAARAQAAAEPAGPRPAPLKAFALQDVRLLDGPFLHAQKMSAAYLLTLEPDRLLHNFRVNAGLQPKAAVYGGWESEATWADIHCHGHSLGHYLSGVSLMYGATGDPAFKARADYIVAELAECQKASGGGLVCAFPEGPKVINDLIAGRRITGVPWYAVHKVYQGLYDAHVQTGSAAARDVLVRFADWAVEATRPLTDAQFETMLGIEHGGMNEVFADLFILTGNAEYRRMADRFSHKAVLTPLSRSQDHLDGLHANTQVPKVVGFQRVFEATGEARYRQASTFFWRTVVGTRSYATGAHGDQEHFYPMVDADQHVFSAKTSETCGVYNMLKLTRLLLMQDPQGAYADYFERALYNTILASQDPDTGMVTYFQGARPGYMKLYCTPVDSFWCCTGTGMENHAKYGESIYFHDEGSLLVNLFIPSTLTWKDKGAVLTQTTAYPDQASTKLTWKLAAPQALALKLRHPAWSPTAEVRVNGAVVARSQTPGGFVTLDRTWQDGDVITLQLAMRVEAQPLPNAPDIFALTYGPLVLAGALGNEGIAPGSDIVVNERRYGEYLNTPFEAPRLAGDPDAIARTVRPAGQPLVFTVADASGRTVRLKPYHRIAHERYVTYWRTAPRTA